MNKQDVAEKLMLLSKQITRRQRKTLTDVIDKKMLSRATFNQMLLGQFSEGNLFVAENILKRLEKLVAENKDNLQTSEQEG